MSEGIECCAAVTVASKNADISHDVSAQCDNAVDAEREDSETV